MFDMLMTRFTDLDAERKAQTVAINKTIEEIEKKVTQMGRYTGPAPAPTSNVSPVINRADTNNINVARADISIAQGPAPPANTFS
ncbi:hypothetical protein HPB50_002457 [Hyalomma asiaticum]|uniref:Uncharacterized protein n=1 Tax=Hyalomma asiaticum TaxID=266040 RepID=A0ACB7S0Z2_HYAAI|nr:hypothetical protein HPB50_002457 [Hyalomma asiaticum]